MTPQEADLLLNAGVPRETFDGLQTLVALVQDEATRQNLISAATMPSIWTRHVVDSLQLLPFAPPEGHWLDIGTGAGFPGLAIAVASKRHRLTLVEPRALRADFLSRAAATLGISDRVTVVQGKVERLGDDAFDIISARAVATIAKLFESAAAVSRPQTIWLLPKGRTARDELAAARQTWQGQFRLEPSLTDADAAIVVATGVQRRTKR